MSSKLSVENLWGRSLRRKTRRARYVLLRLLRPFIARICIRGPSFLRCQKRCSTRPQKGRPPHSFSSDSFYHSFFRALYFAIFQWEAGGRGRLLSLSLDRSLLPRRAHYHAKCARFKKRYQLFASGGDDGDDCKCAPFLLVTLPHVVGHVQFFTHSNLSSAPPHPNIQSWCKSISPKGVGYVGTHLCKNGR